MTIKLITLKTNHTLMGTVDESDKVSYITIKEPVQVVNVPPRAANEQPGIAFMPFLEFSNEFRTGIKIKTEDILTITTPVIELENQYNQVFGSGIQIASSIPKI
jgi:hypothetical protein